MTIEMTPSFDKCGYNCYVSNNTHNTHYWFDYYEDSVYNNIAYSINQDNDYICQIHSGCYEVEGETVCDYSEEIVYAGPQPLYDFQRGYSYIEF